MQPFVTSAHAVGNSAVPTLADCGLDQTTVHCLSAGYPQAKSKYFSVFIMTCGQYTLHAIAPVFRCPTGRRLGFPTAIHRLILSISTGLCTI